MDWRAGIQCLECKNVFSFTQFYYSDVCPKCGTKSIKERRDEGLRKEVAYYDPKKIKKVAYKETWLGLGKPLVKDLE